MTTGESLQPNRRSVLKIGVVGTAILGGGGWVAAKLADGNPVPMISNAVNLNPAAQQALTKICDTFLSEMLPEDDGERAAILVKMIEGLDQTISLTPPWVQKELQDLLNMMTFAPTRFALMGRWGGWESATRDDVRGMLERLRDSSIALKRFVYMSLHDFSTAGFYGLEESWQTVGYDGPLVEGPGDEV